MLASRVLTSALRSQSQKSACFLSTIAASASGDNTTDGNGVTIVKQLISQQLPASARNQVKGVHLSAIAQYLGNPSTVSVGKAPVMYSLSNLGQVKGHRREVRGLLGALAPRIAGLSGTPLNASEVAEACNGLRCMLSSDKEARNVLSALTAHISTNASLQFDAAQFGSILRSMHQLSSRHAETVALLKAVTARAQLDSTQLTGTDVAGALHGLHNMQLTDGEGAVLSVVKKLTKAAAAPAVQFTEVDVGDALYGLASMRPDQAEVQELLAVLTSKVDGCQSSAGLREACASVSKAFSGLQTLLASGSGEGASTPTDGTQQLMIAVNKWVQRSVLDKDSAGGALLQPRELGDVIYSLRAAAGWTAGGKLVNEAAMDIADRSLQRLMANNARLLLSSKQPLQRGVVSTVHGVKDAAHLLQCVSVALMSNATAMPRSNPHKGAYADTFVPDTYESLPSTLPPAFKAALVRAEGQLSSLMESNHNFRSVPFAVALPMEEAIAGSFSRLLRETYAKPKVAHNVYRHGAPCDVLITGNFDYVFNLQCQGASTTERLKAYPLQAAFQENRDRSLRFNGIKIIRLSIEEFEELGQTDAGADAAETNRQCFARDRLFEAVKDDVVEQTYTAIEDTATNDAITVQIEAQKKLWASGGGVKESSTSAPAPVKATGGFKPSGKKK